MKIKEQAFLQVEECCHPLHGNQNMFVEILLLAQIVILPKLLLFQLSKAHPPQNYRLQEDPAFPVHVQIL